MFVSTVVKNVTLLNVELNVQPEVESAASVVNMVPKGGRNLKSGKHGTI